MPNVYVAGVGMTKFGKWPDKLLVELMCEASRKAMDDAQRYDFDMIYVGSMSPEDFTDEGNIATVITGHLGLVPTPAIRVETASSTGATALDEAFLAIKSGYYKSILVIAGEKMTHLPTPKVSKILAEVIDHNERKYGATMVALAAMVTRLYMKKYPLLSREILSMVAVKNHHNALFNSYAQFHKEITIADVLKSKMIADPLRLYDCSPITDGAVAVILISEKKKVKITGIGQGTDYAGLENREELISFRSTRVAAENAYKMAGRTPKEIDVAEIHDAFTPFEIIGSEDVGFFPAGGGGKALAEGITALDGALPINPSGGLKAKGHPVGASGLAQVVEIVWQLRGEAGKRQVPDAKIGLTQSVGGLANNNLVTILEAE